MKIRFLLILLFSVSAVLSSGCGKGEGSQSRPPELDFTDPVYPVLPDTAPLRDQLDEAAAFVEREFLEEQEKFFLQRGDEIQAYYRGPDGTPLVPEASLGKMLELMRTSPHPRLKIVCRRFHLKASQGQGGVREAPESTTVRMLGNEVPAKAEYAGKGEGTRLRLLADYEYPGGAVRRDILYHKQADGRWRRVRIQESGSTPNEEAVQTPPEVTTPYTQRPPR